MQNTKHLPSRRNVLAGIVAAPTLAIAAPPTRGRAEDIDVAAATARVALKDATGTKLVLLGTGSGPVPGLARRMSANLMAHNGAAYVLDCGLGVTDEYARTGITFSALRSIFITRHHPDCVFQRLRAAIPIDRGQRSERSRAPFRAKASSGLPSAA